MILSYHFIRKRIAQLLKRPISRERQFLSLEQADSILLIFKQENQEEAEACMAQLEAKGKKVKQFIYADAPMEKSDDPDRIGCSKKDLDIWAFPRKEIEQAFLSLKADILIDLIEDKDCFPIYYLELQHTARMKIGPKRENGDFYDFSLSVNQQKGIQYIFDQILFYLQTFRTK